MQAKGTFWNWITSKSYILVVALLTLLIAHLRTPKNFPFSGQYAFPLQDFLIHFFGTLVLWEIQFWNFRHLYQRKLYEQGFQAKLIGHLLALNLGFTFLFYAAYTPIIKIWVYQQPLTLYGFVVGLLLSLTIAVLINICYLGWQLYKFWEVQKQEQSAATELNEGTAKKILSHLYFKNESEERQIPFQEISYFYSEQKVVFLITLSGKRLLTQYSLADLETLLDVSLFFKINRQVIVHRQAVKSVQKDVNYKLLIHLEVKGLPAREETVSRYKAAEFREWYKEERYQSV